MKELIPAKIGAKLLTGALFARFVTIESHCCHAASLRRDAPRGAAV